MFETATTGITLDREMVPAPSRLPNKGATAFKKYRERRNWQRTAETDALRGLATHWNTYDQPNGHSPKWALFLIGLG